MSYNNPFALLGDDNVAAKKPVAPAAPKAVAKPAAAPKSANVAPVVNQPKTVPAKTTNAAPGAKSTGTSSGPRRDDRQKPAVASGEHSNSVRAPRTNEDGTPRAPRQSYTHGEQRTGENRPPRQFQNRTDFKSGEQRQVGTRADGSEYRPRRQNQSEGHVNNNGPASQGIIPNETHEEHSSKRHERPEYVRRDRENRGYMNRSRGDATGADGKKGTVGRSNWGKDVSQEVEGLPQGEALAVIEGGEGAANAEIVDGENNKTEAESKAQESQEPKLMTLEMFRKQQQKAVKSTKVANPSTRRHNQDSNGSEELLKLGQREVLPAGKRDEDIYVHLTKPVVHQQAKEASTHSSKSQKKAAEVPKSRSQRTQDIPINFAQSYSQQQSTSRFGDRSSGPRTDRNADARPISGGDRRSDRPAQPRGPRDGFAGQNQQRGPASQKEASIQLADESAFPSLSIVDSYKPLSHHVGERVAAK